MYSLTRLVKAALRKGFDHSLIGKFDEGDVSYFQAIHFAEVLPLIVFS